jgi:hypothetical protein
MASRLAALALPLAAAALVGSCIATAPDGIHRQTDQDAGTTIDFEDAAGTGGSSTSTTPTDPHAVIGAEPSHGPFVGGGHVLVAGKGFDPSVRIWFGTTEAQGAIPIDPSHVQVDAPPGPAGPVELSAQNGDDESTRRTLPAGYSYDELYAMPASGPMAGGTVVTIFGQDTSWDETSVARIDQQACTTSTLVSPTELQCTVPQGTAGAKSISVTTGSDTAIALDAYTYEDSSEGYKGGLSGAPLAGLLSVMVFDNYTGSPIPGATVIAGASLAAALLGQADSSGLALLEDPSLGSPITVTVAAPCFSPISFVDVPVDTVVAYLDPILTPLCGADGDPPPVGGKPATPGTITGELVWQGGGEFEKAGWTNVPAAQGPNEQRVAYLFVASSSATRDFQLPSETMAVSEQSPGEIGYGFSIGAYAGNLTLYALAGIKSTSSSPVTFTAYSMGVVRGVSVEPDTATGPVYLSMMTALDQALTLDVEPPAVGPKGPDRLHATVAVELGQSAFATLPGCHKTPLLPLSNPLQFVGLPPLDQGLYGARYVSGASAATGPSLLAPLSVIAQIASTSTAYPVDLTGFVSVPSIDSPANNGAWDGSHLGVHYAAGGYPPDLTVYEISASGGLVRWLVAVPAADHAIELPDLAALPEIGRPTGSLTIAVYGGRVHAFDYGKLTYSNLRSAGMEAYSLDYFNAHY